MTLTNFEASLLLPTAVPTNTRFLESNIPKFLSLAKFHWRVSASQPRQDTPLGSESVNILKFDFGKIGGAGIYAAAFSPHDGIAR
jgi:hypothetical protein